MVGLSIIGGTVYASIVNNPGAIDISADVDSVLTVSGVSGGIGLDDGGGLLFDGTIDSSGVTAFDEADIAFDPSISIDPVTLKHFSAQLQATSDGAGGYCPSSGLATISLQARVKVTEVEDTTGRNCVISIRNATGSSTTITLTTGTSGSLTGSSFKTATPEMMMAIQILGANTNGTNCTAQNASDVNAHYGTDPSTWKAGSITLPGASIAQSFTGSGC